MDLNQDDLLFCECRKVKISVSSETMKLESLTGNPENQVNDNILRCQWLRGKGSQVSTLEERGLCSQKIWVQPDGG